MHDKTGHLHLNVDYETCKHDALQSVKVKLKYILEIPAIRAKKKPATGAGLQDLIRMSVCLF